LIPEPCGAMVLIPPHRQALAVRTAATMGMSNGGEDARRTGGDPSPAWFWRRVAALA
jgi:hypothetical protein